MEMVCERRGSSDDRRDIFPFPVVEEACFEKMLCEQMITAVMSHKYTANRDLALQLP